MQTLLLKAAKKGEGSRGGKIIGHTKGSNRPIYAGHGPAHADYKDFTHNDHSEAAAAHGMAAFRSFKKMYESKDEAKAQKHYSEGTGHQGAAILHSEHAAKMSTGDVRKSLDALHPSDGLHQMGAEFAQNIRTCRPLSTWPNLPNSQKPASPTWP